MSFFTRVTFALFALAAYTVVPGRADVIAFDDLYCTQNPGLDVPCDGSCHLFGGRESFQVSITGQHCMTVFSDSNCADLVATFPNQGNDFCQGAELITANSFRCSSTAVCNN